jgi:hypothetical protein
LMDALSEKAQIIIHIIFILLSPCVRIVVASTE